MKKFNQKIQAFFFLFFLSLIVNSSSEEANRLYEIRLDPKGWGNASPQDIKAVLYSTCDSIHKHFGPLKEKEPLRVVRDKSGPIVLFKRNPNGEIIIKLNTGDRFWCQYAYQMAHEFCHVLCRFKNGSQTNLWFEESLCEMASMFALKSMAKTWKTNPPYSNWKSYASAIDDYLEDIVLKNKLTEDISVADYYKKMRKLWLKIQSTGPSTAKLPRLC